MVKEMAKAWVAWGVYGYVVGPVIDKIIPESDKAWVQGVRDFNRAYTAINKAIFLLPVVAAECGISYVEKKVNKKEAKG